MLLFGGDGSALVWCGQRALMGQRVSGRDKSLVFLKPGAYRPSSPVHQHCGTLTALTQCYRTEMLGFFHKLCRRHKMDTWPTGKVAITGRTSMLLLLLWSCTVEGRWVVDRPVRPGTHSISGYRWVHFLELQREFIFNPFMPIEFLKYEKNKLKMSLTILVFIFLTRAVFGNIYTSPQGTGFTF